MDTVYSNKKYLQSLTAGSDFYRSSNNVRPPTNDYTSYQNTVGRRSTIGPYTHMSKYSYPTDVSLSSHYDYSSWGIWRDSRNLSPSAYSKKQKNIKSFSIILMTAAFIVVLAVLSVAGLAFYFSTFKSDVDDSILVFDGSFHVARGDLYTTGLKYNHTSVYRQKAQFYEKLLTEALDHHGLVGSKSTIEGFGDGPIIHVIFRVFLDMRTIPMSITSVENGIITALMNEMKAPKSPYKNIKIDFDTIDVKRLMDQDLLKSASFIREPAISDNTSSTNFENKLVKKTGIIEKTIHKFSSSHKPNVKPIITEAEIDLENLPIIQGSFEVTKTDADITKRKESFSTQTPTSSLRPIMVSQSSIKVKEPVRKAAIIEKVVPISTSTSTTTTTTTEAPTTTTTTEISMNKTEKLKGNVENPPILDVNLFTSSSVLDREPWHPINPKFPSKSKTQTTTERPNIISENPLQKYKQQNEQFVKETNLFRNNQKYSDPIEAESEEVTPNPNQSLFYKSFTNSGFSTGGKGIERLGTSDVRPYPIPVNKLYTDFKIIDPGLNSSEIKNENIEVGDKFEHIGGGVIVKKQELSTEKVMELTTTPKIDVTEIPVEIQNDTLKIVHDTDFVDEPELTTEFVPKLGDILYDLLDIKDENLESRQEPEKIPPTKLNFHNIRDHILAQTNKPSETTTETVVTSEKPTSSFVEVETVQYNPVSSTPSPSEKFELFPINSKWEFINGTQISFFDKIKNTKKVFNSTLQALIVENEQTRSDEQLFDVKKQNMNNSSNIQNISAIFDTLATKLGISQNVPSKLPPFTTMMNKRNKTRAKTTTTTTNAPKTTTVQTTEIPTNYEDEVIPVLIENGSAEVIIGQAEVEAIDPTRYEELMHLQEATTEMTSTTELVTLLPVKSNSGLRVFKRPTTNGHGHRSFKNSFAESIVRTAVNIRA